MEESKHDDSRSSNQIHLRSNRLTIGLMQNNLSIGNKNYTIRWDSPRT